MSKSYWLQKANPWISTAVMVGGLAIAVILATIYHIENRLDTISVNTEAQVERQLKNQELPLR